jgi:hypothetical protein
MVLLALMFASGTLISQSGAPPLSQGIVRVCTIYFDKDAQRPARVEDSAQPCLTSAKKALLALPSGKLYLVATADRQKDNEAGHGKARVEQDMSGEDLRYADVAAYRAVNTKDYMVRSLHMNPTRIVPFTTYEDGQWVEIYLVKEGVSFKSSYPKEIAPILSRPCTVAPCATGVEEFLIAQPRDRIAK